ncbi:MAG: hypothetical protein HFI20_11815 [Lachnospiraceae bacterium]|nr:hypothetical protein [Lachnospiraceae bacterium]MCI9307111.1 hypothetical protein [Lachnospiraceae bacterium]
MDLKELIQLIEKRPQMFIGNYGLETLSAFINGFLFSNNIAHKEDYISIAFENQFHNWTRRALEKRTGIEFDEERNYVYYINKTYQDERHRLKIFFELCNEFFQVIDYV